MLENEVKLEEKIEARDLALIDEEPVKPEQIQSDASLAALIDRVLEKGLVVNADITVSVADTELLGIKIRAALASFATAAKFGLQFPSGTNMETAAWKDAMIEKEDCPNCQKLVIKQELLEKTCPWCGWKSAKSKSLTVKAQS